MVGQPVGKMDPEFCFHPRVRRLGVQQLPFPPYRVYLLACVVCSGTVTTGTVREKHRSKRRPGLTPWMLGQDIEP